MKTDKLKKQKTITLKPTGTCFDDALEFLEVMCRTDPDKFRAEVDSYRLVHAILVHKDGDEYAHAWIEQNAIVVVEARIWRNKKVYAVYGLTEYYEKHNIKETLKYPVQVALALNYGSNSYGPWEERFLKLCKNYKGNTLE